MDDSLRWFYTYFPKYAILAIFRKTIVCFPTLEKGEAENLRDIRDFIFRILEIPGFGGSPEIATPPDPEVISDRDPKSTPDPMDPRSEGGRDPGTPDPEGSGGVPMDLGSEGRYPEMTVSALWQPWGVLSARPGFPGNRYIENKCGRSVLIFSKSKVKVHIYSADPKSQTPK